MKPSRALFVIPTLLLAANVAMAQTPSPGLPPLVITAPRYDSFILEVAVDRPVAQAWARVGKYCAISQWLGVACEITSGREGEIGSVRTLDGTIVEALVAKTDLSYTYGQPVRVGVPYNFLHGSLEAQPVTATTSKLRYSFFYDTSMLADDAARTAAKAARVTRFTAALAKMKGIAEAQDLKP